METEKILMKDITSKTIKNQLDNITLREVYNKGELQAYELTAHDGYALHNVNDVEYTDEEGNLHKPYYSKMVFINSNTNLDEYEVVEITEEMEVF